MGGFLMKKRLLIFECALLVLTLALICAVFLAPGPRSGVEASGSAAERLSFQSEDGRLNINTASAAELELLPGVGPVIAGRIVEYREAYGGFRGEYELLAVSGIGLDTLNEFIDYICLEDTDEDTGS